MYFFRCYITARTVKFNHLLVVFFQQLTSMGNYINYILSLIWVNIYIQMLLCVQTTQITFYDLIPKKTERKTCKFQCFQMHHMSLSRFSILHNTYQAVSIILSEFQAFVQPWKYHIKLKSPPPKAPVVSRDFTRSRSQVIRGLLGSPVMLSVSWLHISRSYKGAAVPPARLVVCLQ